MCRSCFHIIINEHVSFTFLKKSQWVKDAVIHYTLIPNNTIYGLWFLWYFNVNQRWHEIWPYLYCGRLLVYIKVRLACPSSILIGQTWVTNGEERLSALNTNAMQMEQHNVLWDASFYICIMFYCIQMQMFNLGNRI